MKTPVRKLAICCALTLGGLLTSSPSQAEISPAWLTLTGQISSIFISPPAAYLVGASTALWNSVLGLFGAPVLPYSEGLRMLTVKQAVRLKPVAIPPKPPAQIFANSYTKVISFGDSMSDTGNMYDAMVAYGGKGLPTTPNARGRFSNGVVVMEAMANAMNLPLVNYAFAGARSGTGSLVPTYGMQQGTLKQIQDCLNNQPSSTTPLDPNALYVIWTGPDDFYSQGNIFNPATVQLVADNVSQGLNKLYARGARHFFVPQMPDLSITPSAHQHNKVLTNYLSNAKARSAELATQLNSTLQAFAKAHPSADVRTFETYTYSQSRMTQAASEGINTTEPCYNPVFPGVPGPVCANPDKYLFWDTNHPTAAGSIIIGTDFAKAIVTRAPLPSR